MKAFRLIATILLLLCIVALPAFTDQRRKISSSTKEFLIDGKRYRLERSAGDDRSLIRREASRLGIDVRLEALPHPSNPCFEDALREIDGPAVIAPLPLPKGLLPDHVVKLVSDAGSVELAVGPVKAGGQSARNRLPATGWKCIQLPGSREPVTVATLVKGKELHIVFLDEKTGNFLFVRKAE